MQVQGPRGESGCRLFKQKVCQLQSSKTESKNKKPRKSKQTQETMEGGEKKTLEELNRHCNKD